MCKHKQKDSEKTVVAQGFNARNGAKMRIVKRIWFDENNHAHFDRFYVECWSNIGQKFCNAGSSRDIVKARILAENAGMV